MDSAREPLDDRTDALRLAARAAYTLERHPVSLRELGAREPFRDLSYRQLYGWYQEEGWAEERRLNAAAWRRESDDERRARETSRRDREAEGLRRLLEEAAWLRRQPTVRPKSWEAVAGVHIKTVELFRQWEREEREAQERAEEMAMARQSEGRDIVGDISDEETRRMAHFLLERRLDLARQEQHDDGHKEPEASSSPRRATGGG